MLYILSNAMAIATRTDRKPVVPAREEVSAAPPALKRFRRAEAAVRPVKTGPRCCGG